MGNNHIRDRFNGNRILNPSLKLFGGKVKTRDILYHLFPDSCDIYREPFLGTGGILLETPIGSRRHGFDINEDVVNYYEVITYDWGAEAFWDALEYEVEILYSKGLDAAEWGRERFESYKHFLNQEGYKEDRVLWAVAFYLMTKLGFNGLASRRNKAGKLNCPYCKQIRGRGIFTRKWFDEVRAKLKKPETIILQGDFRQAFAFSVSATKDSFWMIDPPYRDTAKSGKRQDYNGIPFTDKDHIDLKECLDKAPGRFLVTINDDDFTRDLYKDYNIYPHENFYYSCSNTPDGRGKKRELIITNYDIERQWREVQTVLEDAAKPKRSKVSRHSRPLPSGGKEDA